MTVLFAFLAVAWHDHGETLLWTAAILAACGVIYRTVVQPTVRRVRRVIQFFMDLREESAVVRKQLMTNNGGSTVLDRIDGLVKSVDLLVENSIKNEERTQALEEWRMKQEGES